MIYLVKYYYVKVWKGDKSAINVGLKVHPFIWVNQLQILTTTFPIDVFSHHAIDFPPYISQTVFCKITYARQKRL